MTTIWARLEADFAADEAWVTTELNSFGAGVSAFFKTIEPQVAEDASQAFDTVLSILVTAGVDVVTGLPVGNLITSVLNVLSGAGKTAATQIAPAALNAIAAIKIGALTPATPGAIGAAP